MSRLEANKKLVKLLSDLVDSNPDQRFSQILRNYGFIKEDRPARPEMCISIQNEFYVESDKILERVEERVKDIKGQSSDTTSSS
jgi:hypothetical protein